MSADFAVSGIMLTIVMVVLATLFSGMMLSSIVALQELNHGILVKDGYNSKAEVKIVFSAKISSTEAKLWIKNVGEAGISSSTIAKSTLLFGPSGNFKVLTYGNESPPYWNFTIIDEDEDGKWSPQETLEISIIWSEPLPTGDYYAKFVLYGGIEDSFTFKIPF